MHQLPTEILRHIKAAHESAGHREKRKLLARYADMHNLSVATLYRRIEALDISPVAKQRRADYGQPRITEKETLENDMRVIAGIMRESSKDGDGEFLAAEIALDLAVSEQLISREYNVHTVNRWLARMGLNRRGFQTEKKAVKLVGEYSNHIWEVDATVSNLYYLSTTGKVIRNDSLARDKSHADDRIRKLGLKKIWLYVAVDLFSRAWWCRGFADEHLGENSADYFEFFRECFLPKAGIPMHGLPRVIYSDPGSALRSKMIQRMCDYLGIKHITHEAHLSRATGAVESRIHVIKRQGEAKLALLPNSERPQTIEQYNDFIQGYAREHNAKSGAWIKWHKNTVGLVTVTDQDIINSVAEPFTRLIDVYGCISVDAQKYEVVDSHELIGQKVDVWRRLDGSMVVQSTDGRLFAVKETGAVEVIADGKHGHKFPKSPGDLNREIAIVEGKKFRRSIMREDVASRKQKVLHMPAAGTPLDKPAPVPLDEYQDIESAWLFLTQAIGYARAELPEDTRIKIDTFFEALMGMEPPVIRGSDLMRLANSLQKQLRKEIERHG